MSFWGVVRSLPMNERFAASQLELRGFETFLPLIQTKRATQPLFGGYLFCRILDRWRTINTCFGIIGLVRSAIARRKCPTLRSNASRL
jgi:Transcription termination factor nusG